MGPSVAEATGGPFRWECCIPRVNFGVGADISRRSSFPLWRQWLSSRPPRVEKHLASVGEGSLVGPDLSFRKRAVPAGRHSYARRMERGEWKGGGVGKRVGVR